MLTLGAVKIPPSFHLFSKSFRAPPKNRLNKFEVKQLPRCQDVDNLECSAGPGPVQSTPNNYFFRAVKFVRSQYKGRPIKAGAWALNSLDSPDGAATEMARMVLLVENCIIQRRYAQ